MVLSGMANLPLRAGQRRRASASSRAAPVDTNPKSSSESERVSESGRGGERNMNMLGGGGMWVVGCGVWG